MTECSRASNTLNVTTRAHPHFFQSSLHPIHSEGVGGKGGCHLTKLARWTRGWGPLEAIAFCEAAQIHCVVALSGSQSPEQLADFVEYLFGDAGTRFGGLRVADGHPAPYRLPSLAVQVSNERCMSVFVSSLAQQMVAMEAVARRHGMGGRLQYVAGSYLGIVSPNRHCPAGGPNATLEVLREVHHATI